MASSHRWWYLLAAFGVALIAAVAVATVPGSAPPTKPVANIEAPQPTVVRSGLPCGTEAEIKPTDSGTLLLCALAKDGKLRWRRA